MMSMMKDVVLPGMLFAHDMAYFEEAPSTVETLHLIQQVMRYELDGHDHKTLKEEVLTANALLRLYRFRFGSFEFMICHEGLDMYMEVEKYILVSVVLSVIEQLQVSENKHSKVKFMVEKDEDIGVTYELL